MQNTNKYENYLLKSSSFSDELNAAEQLWIKEKMVRLEFKKDQLLFKEGSFSKGLYIVRKGKIKIYKAGPQGEQSIVYIYKKGEYFGYRPLLAEAPQPVSAIAMENVVVSFVSKEAFLNLFNRSDSFARKIALTLATEFSVWINKMTVFTQYSVKERVALSLLIFNQIYQKPGEKKVVISISRDDFASFVGTAKESLVRTLRLFKDEKIISTQSTKIVILKPDALNFYF
jgi:CRP-like cAMP-binding protein